MARSFHKNKKTRDRFTVEIESLDQDGRGVAHREGKAVFVEGALPHEVVTYERIRNKTSFEIGRLVELHNEGPLRVKPRCPHFGLEPGCCGGCAMQHLDPFAQVAIKQRVLLDALWHIGKTKPENILPPIYGPFWGYRHRARFTVRDVTKKGGVLVGFHERSSSYVADMHSCAILPKHVSDMIDPLRELVSTLTIRQRLPQIEVVTAARRWFSVTLSRSVKGTRRSSSRSATSTARISGFRRRGRIRLPRSVRSLKTRSAFIFPNSMSALPSSPRTSRFRSPDAAPA